MKITVVTADKNYGELMANKQIHLVVPATSMGFGMCNAYLQFHCKMDGHNITKFVHQVNDKREVGCLHPKFPMTLFPSKYDEWQKNRDGFTVREMNIFFQDIFEIEQKHIKSNHIVIDLMSSSMSKEEKVIFYEQLKQYLESSIAILDNCIIEFRPDIV